MCFLSDILHILHDLFGLYDALDLQLVVVKINCKGTSFFVISSISFWPPVIPEVFQVLHLSREFPSNPTGPTTLLEMFSPIGSMKMWYLPTSEWLTFYGFDGGFIKKNRPFNHIFGGDRILRAWYRGIKNAGPRKRAQGRAQDTPYHIISPYHNGIWRIFIECGKNPTRARARKGEAQGVLSYRKVRGIFDNPHVGKYTWILWVFFRHISVFFSRFFLQDFGRPPGLK